VFRDIVCAALAVSSLFLAPLSAKALDKSDVRSFVHNKDFDGIEAAFDLLQEDVRSGISQLQLQRKAYGYFGGTDPAIEGFVTTWVKKYPASAHAHLARSISDYEAAFRIRGPEFSRYVYPKALKQFQMLQKRAMDHVLQAHTANIDLEPAATNLLRIGVTNLSHSEYLDFFMPILERHPTHRVFGAGAFKSNPSWGGTWDMAVWLCDEFSDKIVDVKGYTPDVCKVDLAFSAQHGSNRAKPHAHVFETSNSPVLDRWRPHYALYINYPDAVARHRALEAAQTGAVRDPAIALEFDRYHRDADMSAIVYSAKRAEAELELPHDPYNADYLDLLRNPPEFKDRPDLAQQVALLKASLYLRPYESARWFELAEVSSYQLDPENPEKSDPYFINAIVYSNHRPEAVAAYRAHRERLYVMVNPGQLASIRKRGDLHRPTGTALGEMTDADLICPYIRVSRLKEALCDETGDPGYCHGGRKNEEILRGAMSKAGVKGICKSEKKMTLEQLVFEPVETDVETSLDERN
jgi:hypothetical protein